MAKLSWSNKIENSGASANGRLSAAEINEMRDSVNAIYDFLFENGLIGVGITLKMEVLPEAELSPSQFEPVSDGIGLKGFENIGSGGGSSKVPTPSLTLSVISTTQINASWTQNQGSVFQRATQSNFSDAVDAYTGSGASFNNTGLTANTLYYFRVKGTEAGKEDSDWAVSSATTQAAGATTPAPPTITGDDIANTTTVVHELGVSEIVASVSNGAFVALTTVPGWNATTQKIDEGNVTRAAGYRKYKIKSAPGRNESSVVNSPAFVESVATATLLQAPVQMVNATYNTATGTVTTTAINVDTVVRFKEYLPAGQNGHLTADLTNLGIGMGDALPGYNEDGYIGGGRNSGNNRIEMYTAVDAERSDYFADRLTPLDNAPAGTRLKIAFDSTTVKYSISFDAGVTFINEMSRPRLTGVDYYIRIDSHYPDAGSVIANLMQVGFSINNSLS